MKAMILAAGLGKRMLPLTADTPKPLLEVAGKPLIEHQLEKLALAGVCEVVINHSYLGEQIERVVGDGKRFGLTVRYSPEPQRLETAGGIIQALPLLASTSFLVLNADLWCDFDVSLLAPLAPDVSGSEDLATLVLVDNAAHKPGGDFTLDAQGRVHAQSASNGAGNVLTYSGISVLNSELFAGFEPGPRPLRPLLEAAIAAGRVGGVYHPGQWVDVGTPERLAAVNTLALRTQGEP